MTILSLLAYLLVALTAGAATPVAPRAGAVAAETPVTSLADDRQLEPGEARQRIAHLRAEIARHDALYHGKAAPEISDYDYDQLKRRLRQLEAAFPDVAAELGGAVAEVGDDRTGLFQTRRHREPMLSLDKAYTEADVRAFDARMAKLPGRGDRAYVIEPAAGWERGGRSSGRQGVSPDGRVAHAQPGAGGGEDRIGRWKSGGRRDPGDTLRRRRPGSGGEIGSGTYIGRSHRR